MITILKQADNELSDDITKVANYLNSVNDFETREALIRLRAVLKSWRATLRSMRKK